MGELSFEISLEDFGRSVESTIGSRNLVFGAVFAFNF